MVDALLQALNVHERDCNKRKEKGTRNEGKLELSKSLKIKRLYIPVVNPRRAE